MRVSAFALVFSALTLLIATAPGAAQRTSRVSLRSSELSSTPQDLEARKITMRLENTKLESALETFAEKSGLRLTYSRERLPHGRLVSLKVKDAPALDALKMLLEQGGLEARRTRLGQYALTPKGLLEQPLPPQEIATGSIVGRVTDARSGAGVSGASVMLEGTRFGTTTDNTGRYRIDGVPAGTHNMLIQQIGYAEARLSITVSEGDEATADFALEVSALPLDELVATGTAFAAKMRSLPNPISVITAKEVEAKGAANITDLLRGEIPGVMALSGGQRDDASNIYVRGNAGGSVPDLIKIYIDGVELANPYYLATLDPKSIERVEVVRGPQAAVIYGSESSSGVLQIFTKKGRAGQARPRLGVQASAGVIESAYTPSGAGTPLTQDHSLEVSGGGESYSYRAGAGYATAGEWVKDFGSRRMSFSGGLRAVQGPLMVELTALWSDRGYQYGSTPIYLRFPTGACASCGNPDYHSNTEWALSQNTMGVTLGYQATRRWQHTLTLGDDQNRYANHKPKPTYNTPADTFVSLFNQESRRRSVRYHTAYEAELGERVTARLTAGVNYWSYDVQGSSASDLLNAFGTIQTTSSTGYSVENDGWWNAGYFGMAELGWREALYLTLAGRVEDNPNLGEEYGRAFAPKVGASWVQALGPVDLKLRAQWGKGVRPPPPVARTGGPPTATSVYLPNPAIAPEEKSGWDAGVDVYWGSRASLSLTRFDEEAQNLIYLEPLDLTVMPGLYQYRNIGVVGLEGWEVEGRVDLGRVRFSANYAYSDNVVKRVNAATAANPNATLLPGDRAHRAPKHSGGGRVALRVARGSVSVDGSVIAGWRSIDYVAYFGWLYSGEAYRGSTRAYYVEHPSLWKWNLGAEQALSDRWSAFLRVENLAGSQQADLVNVDVAPGRTTVVGVRWGL